MRKGEFDETEDGDETRVPLQPDVPDLYADLPDDDWRKMYFVRRGHQFKNGRYVGRRTVGGSYND